jgi:two-component system, sensor histidine kinase and response regulator
MSGNMQVRVLVVEDSPTQAEEVRLILESAGFAIDIASNAEQGLDRLERSVFDFVISDIVMPGLSGYELCRRIKSDARWTAVPVLLLTSLTDPIDVIRALECGADSFLGKPCDPEHLIARVNRVLDTRRLRARGDGSGVEMLFAGKQFSISSSKEQILDLLASSFEDVVRKHGEIAAARDELSAKHQELLRVEQQKEELSALVVHDLKSPAAGIMMAAQTRLKSNSLTEVDRRLWGLVYTSAEVINRMVLNLLDIASSSDGVFAPRPRTIDIGRVVQEVERLMTPAAEGFEQALRVDVRPGLPPLDADPELLRRVLQNLVDNALRHSPRGRQVAIEAEGSNGTVVLRVRDQGPGVPPALREQIFDKYIRINRSHAEGAPGKGLGLAFCRIAVEAHGGRIWVEDNQPQGSVFVVRLPAATREK